MDNIQNFKRSHYCGDLRVTDAGKTVSVCGWVQRQRDLGGLIFVDLRDKTGIVQLSFGDSTDRANRYPLMLDRNGIRVALLNYTYGTNGIPVPSPLIVNMIDKDVIAADIVKAKKTL